MASFSLMPSPYLKKSSNLDTFFVVVVALKKRLTDLSYGCALLFRPHFSLVFLRIVHSILLEITFMLKLKPVYPKRRHQKLVKLWRVWPVL